MIREILSGIGLNHFHGQKLYAGVWPNTWPTDPPDALGHFISRSLDRDEFQWIGLYDDSEFKMSAFLDATAHFVATLDPHQRQASERLVRAIVTDWTNNLISGSFNAYLTNGVTLPMLLLIISEYKSSDVELIQQLKDHHRLPKGAQMALNRFLSTFPNDTISKRIAQIDAPQVHIEANRLWYHAKEDAAAGPIPEAEILSALNSGLLTPSTLIWTDGMPTWEPAATALKLADPQTLAPQGQLPPQPRVEPCAASAGSHDSPRSPELCQDLLRQSASALQNGSIDAAIAFARQAVASNEDNSDAWEMLGCLLEGRRDPFAIDCYRQVIRLRPDCADAFLGLVFCYTDAQRWEFAYEAARFFTQAHPRDARAWAVLGSVSVEMATNDGSSRHIDQGIEYYETALRLDPNNELANNVLPSLYAAREQKSTVPGRPVC